jgi:hypothetical protein
MRSWNPYTPWLFAAGSLVIGAAVACSAAQPRVAPTIELSGTYEAMGAGPAVSITFYLRNHYQLGADGQCGDAASTAVAQAGDAFSISTCQELGTYAVDLEAMTLTLSPATAPSRVTSFQVDPAETSDPAAAASLDTLGLKSSVKKKGGRPVVHNFTAGNRSFSGGSPASGKPDPTAGGSWSCNGTYDTQPSCAYYITSFGCSNANPAFGDPGDNCCSSGAQAAAAAGLCGDLKPSSNCSNSCQSSNSCNTWRKNASGAEAANFQCEQMVNYYSTGASTFGTGARLCLSTPNGKGVVVFAMDNGPACKVERKVNAHVLDVSPPSAQYLFGDSQPSATDKNAIWVSQMPNDTPLGPNDNCAQTNPNPCMRAAGGSGLTTQGLDPLGGCGSEAGAEGGDEGGADGGYEGGIEGGDEGGPSEGGSGDGAFEGGQGEAGVGEGGYAFLEPGGSDRHHVFSALDSTVVPFVWTNAPGLAAPADLWVEANGRRVLQVFSEGPQPFARAGLDVVPLVADETYRLAFDRSGDSTRLTLSSRNGASILEARVPLSASLVDVVLPEAAMRHAIDSSMP